MNDKSSKPVGINAVIEANCKVRPETELLAILRGALPEYFDKEGNFLQERFDADLGSAGIVRSRDSYRLNFVGRDYARLQAGLTSETMLVPDEAHNNKPENSNSENLFFSPATTWRRCDTWPTLMPAKSR